MVHVARTRAKRKGLPFSITEKDIVIPEFCPILGIRLERVRGNKNGSPSLDQVIPGLGYVPGNFAVISWRANTIKSHGSAEEHRKVADWLDKFHGERRWGGKAKEVQDPL